MKTTLTKTIAFLLVAFLTNLTTVFGQTKHTFRATNLITQTKVLGNWVTMSDNRDDTRITISSITDEIILHTTIKISYDILTEYRPYRTNSGQYVQPLKCYNRFTETVVSVKLVAYDRFMDIIITGDDFRTIFRAVDNY
jgi:hypothetical protein